jgi:hypothetical protein
MVADIHDSSPAIHHTGVPAQLTLRIIDALGQRAECDIDELAKLCAPHTWNAVFLEIDRLARTGQICLLYRKGGAYAVSLKRAA